MRPSSGVLQLQQKMIDDAQAHACWSFLGDTSMVSNNMGIDAYCQPETATDTDVQKQQLGVEPVSACIRQRPSADFPPQDSCWLGAAKQHEDDSTEAMPAQLVGIAEGKLHISGTVVLQIVWFGGPLLVVIS